MSLDNESIVEMIDDFDNDSKALKKNLYKLCWYMRGGIALDEAYCLSPAERDIVMSVINDNIELTNKTGIPFF